MSCVIKLAKQMNGGSTEFAIMKELLIAVAHGNIGDYDLNNDVYNNCISYLERSHAVRSINFTWKLTDFGKDVIEELKKLEKQ